VSRKVKNIRVDDIVCARLESDRKHFEKVIGGGEWTTNHVLHEYFKILDGCKK